MDDDDRITAKRELGEGRWDKILKRKMTELSVSDDYNEAKHEWVATGNVWWSGMGGEPRPHWAMEHPDQCLCTHRIVYHFEILNTENQIRECVGSDHINTYLIIRALSEEKNIPQDAITEDMIQEWIDLDPDQKSLLNIIIINVYLLLAPCSISLAFEKNGVWSNFFCLGNPWTRRAISGRLISHHLSTFPPFIHTITHLSTDLSTGISTKAMFFLAF